MLPMPATARWSRSAAAIGSDARDGSRRRRWVEPFRALLEQLDDRCVEADRDRARDLEHDAGPGRRPAPALARPVAVPRAGHPHVRPQLEPVVEADHEVLAVRFDGVDRRPDHPLDLRPGPGRPHRPSDEVRAKTGRGPEERVALGHGRSLAD
jgi:hypothetical protein